MIRFNRSSRCRSLCAWLFLIAASIPLLNTTTARAADIGEGLGQYWLPPVRSTHGHQIDFLFLLTFWITMVTFVAVELVLVYFLIRYRHNKNRDKAHFTHGNTRLEMCWTLAPAVIFIALAVANKGVWENLRFNPALDKAETAQILVVGQQFKWNVIYPGPDGKFGKYLIFPKPTDIRWPSGKKYSGVDGPAFLPYDRALTACNRYATQENPLGKIMDDPDGKDDNVGTPGRPIFIPVNRPVEVQLTSIDVIHDFFLPNYRVKLDAVPGLRGKILFTPVMTSKQREESTLKEYDIDQLASIFSDRKPPSMNIRITDKSAGAIKDDKGDYLYATDAKGADAIARNDQSLSADVIAKLKSAGVKKAWAYETGEWELVCEELCGSGHTTMRNDIVVLDQDEYAKRFEGKKTSPTPAPSKPVASAAQAH